MEKEPISKIEVTPLKKGGLSRRLFLGGTLATASLCAGSYLAYRLDPFKPSQDQEKTPTPPKPTNLLPSPTKLAPTATATAVKPQESAVPLETQVIRDRYLIGGINFADQENPLAIEYPQDFRQSQTVVFKDIKILVSDPAGSNYQVFENQPGDKAFVYSDIPSGTFILNLHDGWLMRFGVAQDPLEAEPLRKLIEGDLRNAYPLETIEANLTKIIGFPFLVSQKNQSAQFVITQAKRLDATLTQEFGEIKSGVSLALEPIQNPENSFILMICSGRQPNEPNETFPGRYLFVLQYSQ